MGPEWETLRPFLLGARGNYYVVAEAILSRATGNAKPEPYLLRSLPERSRPCPSSDLLTAVLALRVLCWTSLTTAWLITVRSLRSHLAAIEKALDIQIVRRG